MIRKIAFEVDQVINLLKFRGALGDFKLVLIDNVDEQEVARILKESMFFLSFSNREGLAMPPPEAMACGCVVIGYDGFGGKEYFKEDFCYRIPEGDVICYAKTVERVIKEYEENPEVFLAKGRRASEFILKEYSREREEREVIRFWDLLAEKHSLTLK